MNSIKEIQEITEALLKDLAIEVSQISIITDHELSIHIIDVQSPEQGLFLYNNGELLKALNHIVRKKNEQIITANKSDRSEHPQYTIDVNKEQVRRLAELKSKVREAANNAVRLCKTEELEPMSSYERLIVHTFLQKNSAVKTESVGEGFERRVIIVPIS